jgi:hydrogenase maturation protease
VEALRHRQVHDAFSFAPEKQFEYVRGSGGQVAGVIVRERRSLSGAVDVACEKVEDGVFKISLLVRNTTRFDIGENSTRDEALLSSMASAHSVLGVQDGKFISLTAPPERLSEIAASCRNVGAWPVLVGEEGKRDTVLSSPIILYDYPQIAPESAGDLFDGTEIDEILSLRIMTLTDDEKREMSESDERARQMLERTETMPVEQFMKLHGVLRGLRPVKEEVQ